MKIFSLLYQGDIHLSSSQKIIPSDQYTTLVEAKDVLTKAHEDAKTYRSEVEKECELLKQKAQEDGFQEGLAKFNDHILLFEKHLSKIQHEMQKAVIPLALKAAKKIVSKELELHPETVVDIVSETLSSVKQSHNIKIFVNKQDLETLEAHKPKLKEIFEHLQSLSIQERSDVAPGGCIIETESGIINASIENQWKAIERAFDKYMQL